jgi:DsbC/DsbD-like thiol-disulfide interchange protein
MRAGFNMSGKHVFALAGVLVILFAASGAHSQGSAGLPDPATVVKPQAYVSTGPIPKGKEFQIAVVVEIARGFHMNSHKPTDEYLIPTSLTAQLPAGFQLADTLYPEGKLEKFSFSPNKALDVYTGRVTLKMRLTAQGNAPLGPATIPLTLRYQACNNAACLPPVKVPVMVPVTVAAAGAKAQALHPELFSGPDKKT